MRGHIQIAYDTDLSIEQIVDFLSELFPGLIFFDQNEDGIITDQQLNYNRLDHVIISVDFYEEKHELQHMLIINGCLEKGTQERSIHIARTISLTYQTRASVDFIPEGETWESGICLLFNNGKSFLADDYFTYPMTNKKPTRPIEILREYDIPEYQFDPEGDLLGTK